VNRDLEKKTRRAYQAARYSGLGIELAVFLVAGVLGGKWVDDRWGTAPWGFFGGLALGIAGAVRSLQRTLRQLQRQQDEPEEP
jgi:F0F1-type ATP synthase assembly protein I